MKIAEIKYKGGGHIQNLSPYADVKWKEENEFIRVVVSFTSEMVEMIRKWEVEKLIDEVKANDKPR